MYLAHYGLNKKPFDISPDPAFLWLGEKHREGLAILKYGILENKGFLLITGDVGTGKTALIRAIEKEVQARAIVVTIPDPGMSLIDFFNFMAAELKMGRGFQNKGDFLIHFKRLMLEAFSSFRRVLLIIDESQRLTHELLEEIRLLSNIDLAGKVLINIFFVGQTEFRQILATQENRAIRQRITVSYHISPLTEEEVQQYITHRLKVAGTTRDIFTPEAIRAVHRYSNGYPRLINIICDHALMSGYANGMDRIGVEVITECRDELKISFGGGLPEEKNLPQAKESEDRLPNRPFQPDDQANRVRRSTLIFAACLVLFAAGWYVFRDRISDELARWGAPHELQESRTQAGSEGGDSLRRVPPLPAETGSREQKPEKASEPPPAGEVASSPARPSAAAPSPQADTSQHPAPLATAPPKTEHMSAPPAPAPPDPPPGKSAAPAPEVGILAAAAPPEPFSLKDFTVYFTQNSTEIPLYANDVLSAAVVLLKSNPETRGRIEGHSDSIGDPSYNILVSENRAASVKNYLVRQGVEASRLTISGFGSGKPIEGNETPEGRSKNRRVVVRIVSGQSG